jgi:hypothetical protein
LVHVMRTTLSAAIPAWWNLYSCRTIGKWLGIEHNTTPLCACRAPVMRPWQGVPPPRLTGGGYHSPRSDAEESWQVQAEHTAGRIGATTLARRPRLPVQKPVLTPPPPCTRLTPPSPLVTPSPSAPSLMQRSLGRSRQRRARWRHHQRAATAAAPPQQHAAAAAAHPSPTRDQQQQQQTTAGRATRWIS